MNFDFEKLEFNPYEVLNLDNQCNKNDIKKKYKKLVLKFHPDKNKDVENADLIFDIVNQSYNILLHRKDSYDSFLENKTKSNNYIDLKENFKKEKNNKDNQDKIDSVNNNLNNLSFAEREKILNEKHKFNSETLSKESSDPLDKNSLQQETNRLIEKRNRIEIPLDSQHDKILESKEKFNLNFEDKNHSISDNEKNKLSVYQGNNINNNLFSELSMVNELYQENNINNEDYYSNLEDAFKIQNINIKNEDRNINLEERMKEYENQTDRYLNQTTDKFSKKTYEEIVGISEKSIEKSIENILPKEN